MRTAPLSVLELPLTGAGNTWPTWTVADDWED